ncbi:glycine zipper domain-containing protein [Acinetobacter modestus]|uniref:glycine zipper domain-containing protein n=1 Tax=Acinetobacter modestus TaxID=1776740 RepID=UPI0030169D32
MINKDEFDRERIKNSSKEVKKELNADPLSGEPGAHPIGTGVGAASGAVAGATIGSAGGPVGTLVGGAVGAVVGGLAGSAVGEAIDPTVEDAYWRENYLQQPYYNEAKAKYPDLNFDRDYQGAYRLGYEKQYGYDPDVAFDEVEPELRLYWDQEGKADSRLSWDEAKEASRDAWNRRKNLNK